MDSGVVLPQGAGYGVGKDIYLFLVGFLTFFSSLLVVGKRI